MPYSDSCREKILSEDYRDFIVSDIRMPFLQDLLEKDYCLQNPGFFYQCAYLSKSVIKPVSLENYSYFSIPKCYSLLSMQALNQAGILPIQNHSTLQLSGKQVMIGFLDTGIDYKNPVFQNLDKTTRIAGIWDQTIQSGTPPESFDYGSHYTRDMINEALASEDPYSLVPSVDNNGHGTFLASIAAGSGDPGAQFIGAAPESVIAVVKLKQAKQYLRDYYFIPDTAPAFQENDIMLGMRYLHLLAEKLKLPLIFCLALGSNLGGHSGSLPLSIIAQQYTLLSNRIPVIGVGNEADQRHHFYSEIMNTSDTKTVEIRVGENTSGFVMELWTELPNILSISLTSPSGESTSRIPIRAGTSTTFNFLFENTTVYIDYRLFVESTTSELIHFRFSDAAPGIWKLVVEPIQIIDGRFHIWLPVREFLSGEVYFLNSNPYYTLTAPSDSVQPISVSYYDSSNNGLALSSGRGFTRTEQVKPDFTAPGISITGALPGGQFESRSGSSTSVGITAGAAALLVEWHLQQKKIPSVDTALIKSLLTLGATRNPDMKYPNREWGYGQLNLYNTFEAMRQL
ncbi:MAG: S8 family peptidase [Mediterraneibacter gnavus]